MKSPEIPGGNQLEKKKESEENKSEENKIRIKKIEVLMQSEDIRAEILSELDITQERYVAAVQNLYHSELFKRFLWKAAGLFSKTGIKPEYTKEEIELFDEKLAKSTTHTAGWGIGHEDAESFVDYKNIKEILPLDKLPKYKAAVEKCYMKTITHSFVLDGLCLYRESGIAPDLDKIAKASNVEKQKTFC